MLFNISRNASLFFLIIFLWLNTTQAQNYQWGRNYGSSGGDFTNKITVDASGNVIGVGGFMNTVDFDPGTGVSNLVAPATYTNGYVIKQTSAGVFTAVYGFVGSGTCYVRDVVTDATGNIYVGGFFSGTIDFDPSAGVNTMSTTSTTDNNAFICKLSSAGALLWVKQIANSGGDYVNSIALDAANNVYAAGSVYTQNADLDPGPGTSLFTNLNGSTAYIIKLDNSGNYLTGQTYDAGNNDSFTKIIPDASGNVYVVGEGSSGMQYINNSNAGVVIAKIGPVLTSVLWSKTITRTTFPNDASVDAHDMVIDASGNLYITGEYYYNSNFPTQSIVDFDPGPSTYTIATGDFGLYRDAFLFKLNSTGDFVWAKNIAYNTQFSAGYSLGLDPSSNVYVAGVFQGATDFNKSGTGYINYSNGNKDLFVSKFNSNGTFLSNQTYGGALDDEPFAIKVNGSSGYYLSGNFKDNVDFSSGTLTNTLTSNGDKDGFIVKYNTCTPPSPMINSSSTSASVCVNGNAVIGVNSVSGMTYNWCTTATGSGTLGTGISYTTPAVTTPTVFWVTGANVCGSAPPLGFSITPIQPSTVNVTNSTPTICAGGASTLVANSSANLSYTWLNSGATSSVIAVSPTTLTTYTVNANNGYCITTKTVNVNVYITPSVTFSYSNYNGGPFVSSDACAGASMMVYSGISFNTLQHDWGQGYTPSNSHLFSSLTASNTYTLLLKHPTLGCVTSHTFAIAVHPNPTVTVTGPTVTCNGAPVVLTASGADTYTWGTNPNVTGATLSYTPAFTGSSSFNLFAATSYGCYPQGVILITVINNVCTGIDEVENYNSFYVYPNPSDGIINIEIEHESELQIVDLMGKVVHEAKLRSGTNTIPISNLSDGVYYFKVKEDNSVITKKIIKQ